MTNDTSIGLDEPHDTQESGIDDETPAPKDGRKTDLTREDIEAGNDRNTSADQGNRSGRTNKLTDDSIEVGKP